LTRGGGLGPIPRRPHPEPGSSCRRRLAETTIPATSRLLAAFRGAGRPVVYTRHGPLLPDGSALSERRRGRDEDALARTDVPALWHKGTFEHEIVDALAPQPGELVV